MKKTMNDVLAPLNLLQHPFYQDWMAGRLSSAQLKDYACQYYTHVAAFPRYLGAIHSHCEDAADRKVILENLNDEEGTAYGTSHPELWVDFASGMGAGAEEVRATRPRAAIQKVQETFFRLSRSSLAEGLGALYAYESQVPEIAASKIEGLVARYGVEDEKTLRFFEVHRSADVGHREALDRVMAKLSEEDRAKAVRAAEEAATSLWNFLTDVQEHAA